MLEFLYKNQVAVVPLTEEEVDSFVRMLKELDIRHHLGARMCVGYKVTVTSMSNRYGSEVGIWYENGCRKTVNFRDLIIDLEEDKRWLRGMT